MVETISEPATVRRRGWLGWPGLVVGLVALAVAAGGPWIARQLDPPPVPLADKTADFVVHLKERTAARLRGEESPPPTTAPFRWSRTLPGVAVGLGVCGLALGTIGLVRREDARLTGSAVALGTAAIVFQWVVIVAGAILGLFLLAWLLSLVGGA